MKRTAIFFIGIMAVALIAACGSSSTSTPSARPSGTPAPVATTEPVATSAPVATATTAPPPTEAPDGSGSGAGDGGAGDGSGPGGGGGAAAIERGQSVFSMAGCTACHTIEGLAGAVGKIGPELTHIATVATSRTSLSAEEYIRESVNDPPKFIVDGFGPLMPPTIRSVITDDAFEDLVAFLMAQQ